MTIEAVERMIKHLSSGHTVKQAAEQVPGATTVDGFFAVIGKKPYLKELYHIARDKQIDAFAEDVLFIADQDIDHIQPQLANAEMKKRQQQIDTRRWLVSKLKPQQYGDKVDVNIGGQAGNPIRLESITRRMVSVDGNVIDVSPTNCDKVVSDRVGSDTPIQTGGTQPDDTVHLTKKSGTTVTPENCNSKLITEKPLIDDPKTEKTPEKNTEKPKTEKPVLKGFM